MWCHVLEKSLCVSSCAVIPSVSRRSLRACVTVVCPGGATVCVGLLVDAYQCRQLSAQLAPPSFIGKDVIVQGPYLGVCLKKCIIGITPPIFPLVVFSTRSCKLSSVSNYAFKKKIQ